MKKLKIYPNIVHTDIELEQDWKIGYSAGLCGDSGMCPMPQTYITEDRRWYWNRGWEAGNFERIAIQHRRLNL